MPNLSFLRFLCLWSLLVGSVQAQSNIASQKPVTFFSPTGGGTTNPAANVTDGDSSTFTHPAVSGNTGCYYQIDLGQEYPLQAIDLYSRVNLSENRLSNIRMAVYSDNAGVAGVERWGYTIRADGSNNPQGGVDHLTANLHPTGIFRGRFVRLTNVANTNFAPQIAEIEVFEAPTPNVQYFGTDVGNITKIGAPGKPTQAVITWNVAGSSALSIDQGIGTVAGPSGSVIVSPNSQTTYTLTATNGAGSVTKAVTIGVDAAELPPYISEFMAWNEGGIRDAEGNRPDWIEIANPNAFAINLQGFYLTDRALQKTKWQFPAFTVQGNSYAVVWASNAAVPTPALQTPHTNFSLAVEGEYLALVAKDGTTVLSQYPADYPTTQFYPLQEKDHSYGSTGAVTGYYKPATPNAPNGTPFAGVVADTVFSVKRGFFNTAQSVAISTATTGAQIRYTTDTSLPTATTGTLYTAPINVTATTVLRVAAYKPGWAPTNVDTQTYIFPANVKATAAANSWVAPGTATALTDAQMESALKQVPTLSLTYGPGVTIDGGEDKLATLEWVPTGAQGSDFMVPCGVQLFGGAFTNFAKKSFRLSFKGSYGASKLRFPLFAGYERGLAAAEEFDQLELRNGSHDMQARGFYLSNYFTDATMLDMGSFAPHSRWVHLFLNGKYWGVYQMRERWSAQMMAEYYGGLADDYESVNGNLNVGGWADPGLPYDGTDAGWTNLKTLARSGADTYSKLRPYLDVPQYQDYMIMFMFGKSEDEYRTTGPVGMGHGYKFLLNDADGYLYYAAYGGPGSDRTSRSAPGKSAGDGPGSLFSMLYKDGSADYRISLADRIHCAYVAPGGAMTPARNSARLDELCNFISEAFTVESARWNYQTVANWNTARNEAKGWFNGTSAAFTTPRTTTVLGHYTATGFYPNVVAPVYTPAPTASVTSGSSLSMATTTTNTTIFYSKNGQDPRVSVSTQPNTTVLSSAATGKYRVPTSSADGISLTPIPNLVSYYNFNTNALDSVGTNHGTAANGAAIATPGQFGAGCMNFDGVNDSVLLGNPTSLQILGQITLAAWVKPSISDASIRNIINKGHDNSTTPNGEITLRMINGAYQCGYWAGSLGTAIAVGPSSGVGSAAADVGSWHHLAAVYDGGSWRLYRDGVQIAAAASTVGAVSVPNIGWAIGARGNGGERYFGGQIDEVRIYNRGLNPTEVAALAANSPQAPGAGWAQRTFDDSGWAAAENGLGFAPVGDGLRPGVTQDISSAMHNVNSSIYLRLPFNLTDAERQQTLSMQLQIKADDGYVAYLNGTPVASRNAPALLDGVSAATAETPDATALAGQTLDISNQIGQLVTGTNVLAIHGLNLTAGDDDALFSAQLLAYRAALQSYSASAPPTLTENSIVRSRARTTGGVWSAMNEAFYQVGPHAVPPGSVVVSELHFNPIEDADGEFVELMNVSTGAINLRGCKFTFGVQFTFPDNRDTLLGPGERLVLVDSQLTFQRVHGWDERVAGIYRGNLSNGGERIKMVSADGLLTLIDFTYDGADPWPDVSDGGGRSLVLMNPKTGLNLSDACNWRPSLTNDGNPNTTDALSFTGNATADADGDGLTSLLEWSLGTSDTTPSVPPLAIVATVAPEFPYEFTLEHRAGADSPLRGEVSTDLQSWTPAVLRKRELLPSGKLRSTWRAENPDEGRLFFRVLVTAN